MPSDLTGRAVYVVSSGLQMNPQMHDAVETEPVKLFSNVENARAYARDLAKMLFWDKMIGGCPHEDGYTTPTDDDFSCGGDFHAGEDYIEFSYEGNDRYTDDEPDTGYVSVDVMYIDEEVKGQTNDTGDNNKKRKLVGNNFSPVNDQQPASSMPLYSKAASFSSENSASSMPTTILPSTFPLSTPTSMPRIAPMPDGPRYPHYVQPGHIASPNQLKISVPQKNEPYGENSANAHDGPSAPLASYSQPASTVGSNSYSNPIVLPDSPTIPQNPSISDQTYS
ncbi:hypothetical protein V8B55DRAFT_1554937 [Mucor lusitanicus]|uniref:Uncharacterized protein n=2 Tax=Mucor circinelloides f. lusitanicus TaxID=29924 RepID=A0A168GXY3_MUCCL|nr:hypothetical protein FB192DRAFT_1405899 [Mucor lusitanicus]OAC98141.1 hypothetical protein MUCCIDRAFT_115663 [Mucor lusitanicus CBS 277.49]